MRIRELQLIGYDPLVLPSGTMASDIAAVLGSPQSTVIGEKVDATNPIRAQGACAIRVEFSVASAGASGVLYEAGGSGYGTAVYIYDNSIYASSGSGAQLGDLPDRYEVTAPISVGSHEAVFTVGTSQGAQLYVDGMLLVSTPAKPGVVTLSGGDPGGTGRVYSSVAANYAGWPGTGNGASPDVSVVKAEIWTSHYTPSP